MRPARRVLIIEDDTQFGPYLMEALAGQGLELHLAFDGAGGLALQAQVQPDLVVTDLNLPKREGIDIVTTLRRQAPGLRIIAMSGGFSGHTQNYLDMARRLGADAALQKPFMAGELLDLIKQLLPEPD